MNSQRSARVLVSLAILAALAAGGLAFWPLSAAAQIPVTDVAHTVQTIAHYVARLVEIGQRYVVIANQVRQLAQQVRQIELQIQGLKKLDRYWFRNVTSTMGAMEQVLAQLGIPSHMSPAVRQVFDETFPGWERLPADWWEEEELAASTTLKTLRETLWANHLQHRTTVDDLHTLGEIKREVTSIKGTEEALESIASATAYHAEAASLGLLAAAASADAATAYYAYQVNLRARQEASLKEALLTSDLWPPDLGSEPGWGALPSWWSAP
jgi:P-type conjugative transfer protein TrbJ